jgi:tetratricopeptide (TPR) repeat protein
MRRLAEVAGLGLALISASPSSHAQTAGIRADQGSVAIAGNVSGSTITIGIPQEKVDELVKERTKPLEELTAAQRDSIGLLREKLDLNERQVRAALDILGEANVSPERLAAKLVEVAEQFKALKATAAAEPGDDSSTTALKADAQKAIDAGDLAKADGLLAQAETAQKKARDRLVLNLAETSAKRGEIALTRLHYGEAAQHFADAAATFAADSAYEDKRAAYLERQADALYQQGYEFGDDGALRSAIELQKRLVELFPRARKPVDWTRIQHNLGLQLYTLGARESGTAMLEESVAAYREVLTELSPERTPLDWASAENNLGNSLLAIGEKQTGGTKLDEAIAAYREALKARPRQRVPLDWAATETGLGNGLYAIGIRGSGTAGLEEAVAAYRAALQESTRDRAPLIWATLQNNLGNALGELGTRQKDTGKLEDAVTAYREALKERARERFPIDWATTQYNLADTLTRFAAGATEIDSLKQAVTAYRAALEELTQQRAALYWARAQTNLGNTLFRIGKAEAGTGTLEEAVTAYREASKEWTHESSAQDWAMEQNNIGDVLWEISQRVSGPQALQEAIVAYQNVLQIRERLKDPVGWARAQVSACLSLWTLGYRLADHAKQAAGAAACHDAQDTLMIIIKARDSIPVAYTHQAGEAMGAFSYLFIFIHDYQAALDAADTVLATFSDLDWVNVNRAHALMFLGRSDEAKKIYLGQRRPNTNDSDSWRASIRSDFGSFRKAGLALPLMDDVERAFAKT